MKGKNIFKYFIIIVVTSLITFMVTTVVTYSYFIAQTGQQIVVKDSSGKDNFISTSINNLATNISGNKDVQTIYTNDKFSEIKSKIEKTYIGEIDEEKMLEGALEGYVAGIGDEYTQYLDSEDIQELLQDTNGSYIGVGLYIANNTKTDEILVAGVFEDSPAYKAEIKVGDIIKKIDDVEYKGEDLTKASNYLKGQEGTKVKITIQREEKIFDIEVKREKIKFKYVKSEIIENNIGYIKVSSFDGKCSEDFKRAYEDLQSKGIKGLVIDLRNNGGGLVDQALEMAKLMVPKGSTLLITTDKNKKEEITKSDKEPIINVPIVILVNQYTASASEILTAAVKENVPTAKVIGTQTYGKGVIQGIFLLKDQKSGLKITMQEYLTPSRNKINKIGIKPDIEIELPDEWKKQTVIEKQYDTQLQKAIEILK